MTHISKRKIASSISVRIKRNFIVAATQGRGLMLECLLTPTETLMLAKRLAMIVMLQRGDSTYRIATTLGVSVSTVLRFEQMLEARVFRPVQQEIRKRNRPLLDVLELLLSAGLPSPAGLRTSKRLRRMRRGVE